jgi:hypothetical protein
MKFARPIVVTLIVGSLAGLIALDRHPPIVVQPLLAGVSSAPMAEIPTTASLSTSWYCPGVPGGKLPGAAGSFAIANTGDSAFAARVTLFPADGQASTSKITVAARSRSVVVPADLAPGTITAALIEMTDATAAVEQTSTSQEGLSVTPCVLQPSATWYLADGSTRVDASMNLTLFNPSPSDAIVDLVFADEERTRITKKFEGRVIPARSLVVLDIGQVIQRKERLSVAAVVRSGTIVLGRFQVFRGEDGTRRGLVVGAASASLSTTWRFAAGQNGVGGEGTLPAKERIVLHNPGESDAVVRISLFPATPAPLIEPNGADSTAGPAPLEPIEVVVPARQSAVADLSQPGVPAGLFSTIVTSDEPIVAERALDRQQDKLSVATLQLGSPLASTEWVLPAGAPTGAEATLAIVNVTGLDGKVTVSALSAAGLQPVAGYESVALPAGALIRLDLAAKGVSASAIVVTSTVDVITERVLRSPTGWASSLGLPVVAE